MALQVKRFNWVRTASAYQVTQAWRDRQQARRQEFEAASSAASSTFASISVNQVVGMGSIAAKVASKRMQQERLAKALNALA